MASCFFFNHYTLCSEITILLFRESFCLIQISLQCDKKDMCPQILKISSSLKTYCALPYALFTSNYTSAFETRLFLSLTDPVPGTFCSFIVCTTRTRITFQVGVISTEKILLDQELSCSHYHGFVCSLRGTHVVLACTQKFVHEHIYPHHLSPCSG